MNIREIISETVDQTILKLKMARLIKDEYQTAFQKTEHVLYDYDNLKKSHSEEGIANRFVEIVDRALEQIQNDDYYDIIPMIYFEHRSRDEVAEFYDVTVTTISRNKTRLINQLKIYIFADEVIKELFL